MIIKNTNLNTHKVLTTDIGENDTTKDITQYIIVNL